MKGQKHVTWGSMSKQSSIMFTDNEHTQSCDALGLASLLRQRQLQTRQLPTSHLATNHQTRLHYTARRKSVALGTNPAWRSVSCTST